MPQVTEEEKEDFNEFEKAVRLKVNELFSNDAIRDELWSAWWKDNWDYDQVQKAAAYVMSQGLVNLLYNWK